MTQADDEADDKADNAAVDKPDDVVVHLGTAQDDPGYAVVDDTANENDDPGYRSTDEELDGHCIWYGQCGDGYNGGKLNCAATDKTRNAPYLTDPKALGLVEKLCPDFYKGETMALYG